MCITLLLRSILHYSFVRIRYKNHYYKLYLSDTAPKHMLGLMHIKKLEDGIDGMLFDFKHEQYPGIWMHNMLFPIDIIWLDNKKVVVDVVHGAMPCKSIFKCKTYVPSKPSRYVLELKSGMSEALKIEAGSKIDF